MCDVEMKDVAEKVFPGKLQRLIPIWAAVDEILSSRGLARDVKTIYVSYTDASNNLVAAVHPDAASITLEIALPLPRELDHELLYDASHLKWRTLPNALRLEPDSTVSMRVLALFDEAVRHAPDALPRPARDFASRRRRGRFDA